MSDRAVLRIDPTREGVPEQSRPCTTIYIRAVDSAGKWHTVDIWMLDKESLLLWLRSRGGKNTYAEDVVGILLDHGHLNPLDAGKDTENGDE